MADTTHNINVVWSSTGLDTVEAQASNFANTSGLVAKQQDALATAMGKTEGAAFKTGKEFTKTEKAIDETGKTSQATGKQQQTLGQAFKGSALQIAAFTSGVISTIGQFISYQKATSSLEKAQAILEGRWIALEQAEKKLDAQRKAGTISTADAAVQSEKLAAKRTTLEKQTEILSAKEQQHTLSLVNLATTAIPTVINGISSLSNIYNSVKGTIDAANESTDAASEATETLGTTANVATTSSIIPLLKNFSNWVTGSKDVKTETDVLSGGMRNMGVELDKSEKSSNVLVRAFQTMGSTIKDFFGKIKVDMAGATGITDKLKVGFTSFFSVLGSGLKAGITAVASFGKALLTAFVTNPILLIITGISAAVLALITNFGGFRDMVNGVGVAIGNAIPPLKGLLTWLGEGGNAALDTAASFLGVETNAQRLEKQAAHTAEVLQNQLVVALKDVVNIGNEAQNLQYVITQFDEMRAAIEKLVVTGDDFYGKTITGTQEVANRWEDVKATFVNASPEIKGAMDVVDEVIKIVTSDSFLLAHGANAAEVAEHLLTEAMDQFSDVAGGKAKKAAEDLKKATDDSGKSMGTAAQIIADYNKELADAEQSHKDFALAVASGNTEILDSMDPEEIKAYLDVFHKDFPEGATTVTIAGKKIVKGISEIREEFGGTSQDITKYVGDITSAIQPRLISSLTEARNATFLYNKEQEYLADVLALAEQKIDKNSEAWNLAIAKIIDKYPELHKVATEVINDVIDKEEEKTKTLEKANKETEKAIVKAENLAAVRQKEIEATNALTQSATALATELGVQIRVSEMTGEGIKKLIDLYDETANAAGIAADAIGVWYAELERNQAVDVQTVEKLKELASTIGIEIPQEIIDKGVPAMKTFIEEMTGMGEGAKKVKEEILKTFEDLQKQTQSVLDGIISDKLGEDGDEIKKVLKGVEKAGYALNSFAAEPRIISIFMDDQKFDNDLQGFSEILAGEMDRMGNISAEGGDRAIEMMIEQMRDTLGGKAPEVVADVDLIWKAIQDSKVPSESGNITTAKFAKAMENPTIVAEAIRTNNTAILAEYGLLPPKVEAEGAKVTAGVATGIKNNSGTPAEEMRNMGITMIGQLNLILTDEVNTTLPGFIKLFAAKFTEMGNTVNQLAIASTTHIGTVNKNLLLGQTNVSSFQKVWDAVMKAAGTSAQALATSSTTHLGTVNKNLLIGQTTVSSLNKVWDAAMNSMTSKVGSFASACSTAFGKVGTSADSAAGKVKALQTAINALKDKTVTITYKQVTTGTKPAGAKRFGGSFINYARSGNSWIQSSPMNMSGVNVAEGSKPELITVTPLTNPYDMSDKSIDLGRLGGNSGGNGMKTGGTIVSGDIYLTVQTQSGEVLAKEVRPFLLRGFSGIT